MALDIRITLQPDGLYTLEWGEERKENLTMEEISEILNEI